MGQQRDFQSAACSACLIGQIRSSPDMARVPIHRPGRRNRIQQSDFRSLHLRGGVAQPRRSLYYEDERRPDGSRQGPGGYKPLRREPLLGRVQIHDGGFDHQMGYGNLPRLLRTLRRKDLGQQPADAQSQEKAPCGPLQHARRGRPAGEHASGAHLHAPLPVPPRRHAVVRHPSLRHHGLPLPAR